MFTVYHSNQLELLKSLAARLIKHQPLDSVFQPEIILVQSQGMGQWLQIQLADELGISANIHYPFPTQFIWDIYHIFYPNLPKENIFNIDLMMWVLLNILPNLVKTPQFSSLNHYVNDTADEQKYYQLASCIAQLFDQYLVYRADWLKTWESGELVNGLDDSQVWQAALWRELIAYTRHLSFPFAHRADIHMAVIKTLNSQSLDHKMIHKLPQRIFIFGIVSLPPLYLELFHSLSQYIDVHFMFMNPCQQYWGDIVDHTFLNKYANTDQTLEIIVQETNPLLASWGKLGRDHLALLQNYPDKQDIDVFADYADQQLLSLVQQSILDMQNKANFPANIADLQISAYKQQITLNDDSITFHSCHSEQREVEVLYDNLLAILDNHPNISLNDCVVMVADIDHYAPYIQSVFDNAPKHRYLPYTISDQKLKYIDPIVQGFFLLLELPQSRLEVEYIVDLLEIPAIAKRFSLSEENLIQLRGWIIDAGIRWGLESCIDEPHSWLIGLNRMLLGYIMESKLDSWQGILPYDEVTGQNAELIGFLSDFIMAIAKWRKLLSQPRVITKWQNVCTELLSEFFIVDTNSEPLLLVIEEHWQQIIQQAMFADYDTEVSVMILKNLIQTQFDNHYLSHRFLVGKINFCTMMPMRSVPFKVVCLLGMNDGVYPRTSSPLGFDLISRHARIGDRSRRNDDRYLFLEALLSAEQKLYISYIGRDMQTNDERYPSILVDELLNYLQHSYRLPGDEYLPADMSAEKLKKHLVYFHPRTPFNINNYLKIPEHAASQGPSQIISYADEWLLAAKCQGTSSPFYSSLVQEPVHSLTLDDLKHFYWHPIKELTRKRLKYQIGYTDEQLPDAEYFNLDGLQRYYLNSQIMAEFMLADRPDSELDNKLYQKMLHSNQLPYGAFGHILYTEQKASIQTLIHKINENRQGNFLSQDINLTIGDSVLTGRVKNIQQDGILQWRSSVLTIKDGISLWLDHLAFCAVQPAQYDIQNRMYGRDESEWCFDPLPPDKALDLLSVFVNGYLIGVSQPLFMPLQSSWQWLETAYDTTTGQVSSDSTILYKARAKFITRWQGNVAINPECDDYYERLYPELTEQLIDLAITSTMIYLLPVMQYRRQGI